jgi:hypothetical protein
VVELARTEQVVAKKKNIPACPTAPARCLLAGARSLQQIHLEPLREVSRRDDVVFRTVRSIPIRAYNPLMKQFRRIMEASINLCGIKAAGVVLFCVPQPVEQCDVTQLSLIDMIRVTRAGVTQW